MLSIVCAEPCRARIVSLLACLSVASTLLIASAQSTHAQSTAAAIVLPTVVVDSPTTVATAIEQIASSLTVITAKELERDQRRTVPDALRAVPGLNIVQSGGPGGQTSVFMRGTNSNHVKVLIDGIDASDPSNPGRLFDFGHLQTADIERIEVLRGPQSGLYGADAIGGVISIITKKGEGPPKARATLEGGSFGTFNQAAALSGSQDRFSYAFNIAHLRATDTPVTPGRILPPGRLAIGNYNDNMTYSTKLGADVSEYLTLNQTARYTDSDLRFTGGATPNAAQSRLVVHQFFNRSEAVVSLFDGRFRNYFGFNYTDHWNWTRTPGGTPTLTKGDRTKFDWRGVAQVMSGQTLVFGLEQDNEALSTATLAADNGNKAGYAELQSEFAQRIFLVANIRRDRNDRFGGHTTYRIAPAAILPVTETKLKGSIGTGFKAPTLNQLFVDFPAFGFFANPNLKPETSTGYDFGFEQPLAGNRVRFGVTYFHNDIEDLIAANATFTTSINVGRATTSGIEAFASAIVTERLTVRTDYTRTRATDEITQLPLLRRPRDKTSVTAVWTPRDALTLSATLLRVGGWDDVDRVTFARVGQKGYTTVNLAADYIVNDRATVFGRIDNLFDERTENPNGFLQPGLGIFGGVRVNN